MSMKKETAVYILDLGVKNSNDSSDIEFLEKAKILVRRAIEKKIFTRPRDNVGVILMGSTESTENDYGIKNINVLNDLQNASWDLIEKLMNVQSTNIDSIFTDALTMGLIHLSTEKSKSCDKRLFFISKFMDNNKTKKISEESIVNKLTEYKTKLFCIGNIDIYTEDKVNLSTTQKLVGKILNNDCGEYVTIESALKQLRFYEIPKRRPAPWKCDLELGDIKIPITSYLSVSTNWRLPTWKFAKMSGKRHNDESTNKLHPVKKISTKEDKFRNPCNQEDAINSYYFGREYITYTDEDEAAMKYLGGPKSFKVLGFVTRENIKIHDWAKNNSRVIFPQNKEIAQKFYSFVKALEETNRVVVARKVYNTNVVPRIVTLYPRINIPNKPWCLVEVGFPYLEEKRHVRTTSLKSVVKDFADEELVIVGNLVDALKVKEDEYLPGCIQNPSLQHTWDCLSHRALNPKEPLPPIDPTIKQLLDMPSEIANNIQPYLKEIKRIFFPSEIDSPNSSIQEKKEEQEENEEHFKETEEMENNEEVSNEPDTPIEMVQYNFDEIYDCL